LFRQENQTTLLYLAKFKLQSCVPTPRQIEFGQVSIESYSSEKVQHSVGKKFTFRKMGCNIKKSWWTLRFLRQQQSTSCNTSVEWRGSRLLHKRYCRSSAKMTNHLKRLFL
jgi:hypothetical protein